MTAGRRLARTRERARWPEYRRLLTAALEHGYRVVSLERWLDEQAPGGRVLVLRHDVDQHPRSALAMAAVEEELGVASTWYFRWRTADARVIRDLRGRGFAVGLHYETVSRVVLERRARGEPADVARITEECRAVLREELRAFDRLHGPARSACPHGDSRVPGVSNAPLVRETGPEAYGLAWDGNESLRGRGLDVWLTDRSAADGRWVDGLDPLALLEAGRGPVLCLTHPNNWAAGAALWLDRLLGAALPGALPWPVRTLGDAPPLLR